MQSSKLARRNNYILVVFDSCRYDSYIRARPKTRRKPGRVEIRWSYAPWTAPSHFNLPMGPMPHLSPMRVFAPEYYRKDFPVTGGYTTSFAYAGWYDPRKWGMCWVGVSFSG